MTVPEPIRERIAQATRLQLFLDYDGTLADFAPTPEHIQPDPEVIALLATLADHIRIQVAVISGRRLCHIQELIPLPGILLAGTYGLELLTPEGERIERIAHSAVRPALESLKPRWAALIAGREGFFLEDKGWTLALHARFANERDATIVLQAAHHAAQRAARSGPFRFLDGHRFLEIGPRLAHKGQTVDYLLEHHPWSGALPVYVGDDERDEEAFAVVQAHGGVAVRVAPQPHHTAADFCLPSPQAARSWLAALPAHLNPQRPQGVNTLQGE